MLRVRSGIDRERLGDIIHIAVIIVLAVGGVAVAYAHPALCALWMAAVLGVALWRWHTLTDLLMALSGLTFGPLLEYFATTSGLWTYPHTSFGTLPAWVFVLWPSFPICLVRLTHALLPPDETTVRRPAVELSVGLTVLAIEVPLLVGFGTSHPLPTTIGTVALMAAALWLVRSPQAAAMLLISGVVGPVCESVPVTAGAWSYPNPAAFGLPLWLPTGYALFGFALVRVAFGVHALIARAVPAAELAREP